MPRTRGPSPQLTAHRFRSTLARVAETNSRMCLLVIFHGHRVGTRAARLPPRRQPAAV